MNLKLSDAWSENKKNAHAWSENKKNVHAWSENRPNDNETPFRCDQPPHRLKMIGLMLKIEAMNRVMSPRRVTIRGAVVNTVNDLQLQIRDHRGEVAAKAWVISIMTHAMVVGTINFHAHLEIRIDHHHHHQRSSSSSMVVARGVEMIVLFIGLALAEPMTIVLAPEIEASDGMVIIDQAHVIEVSDEMEILDLEMQTILGFAEQEQEEENGMMENQHREIIMNVIMTMIDDQMHVAPGINERLKDDGVNLSCRDPDPFIHCPI